MPASFRSLAHLFLLVTLAKEGMSDEHQYADHFLSDQSSPGRVRTLRRKIRSEAK